MNDKNPYVNIDTKNFGKIDFDKVDNSTQKVLRASHVSESDKKQEKIHPTRRVYKRNVALSIIYTIITFGFYGWFWQFEITKETNGITKDSKCACPAAAVFFSVITLGIYQVYWAYQVGKKHNSFYEYHDNIDKDYHVLYMVLHICNYVIPIMNLICFGIMQAKINNMLAIANKENSTGIYVKDSSIFNRPYLSIILLIIIAQNIPEFFTSILEHAFPGAPGNPVLTNPNLEDFGSLTQQMIQNSADQVIYADTPFMIAYSVLSILGILAVLWWFKLRFKHDGYRGVLAFKNFGRACLFALPGLVFVALNVFGLNFQNFKIGIILLGFIPAFQEEITFRGMIVPNFLRIFNRPKGIWLGLFISALIFGGIHATNILAGADVGTTIFQVGYAFGLGMLFAGILIRTGNLWTCILLHGLTDAFAMMSDEALKQGAVQTQAFTLTWDVIPIIVISVFFIIYAIWICRPKKHPEIIKLWSDKWGTAVLNK